MFQLLYFILFLGTVIFLASFCVSCNTGEGKISSITQDTNEDKPSTNVVEVAKRHSTCRALIECISSCNANIDCEDQCLENSSQKALSDLDNLDRCIFDFGCVESESIDSNCLSQFCLPEFEICAELD